MGVDLLDIRFRVREQLGVDLGDMRPLFQSPDGEWLRTPPDVSVGELFDGIAQLAASQNVQLPADAWRVLQSIVAECLCVKEEHVTREALLGKDLGCE